MAKKKKQKFELKITRSVYVYVWAVILAVVLPALYIVLFAARANKEISGTQTSVQGYIDEATCEELTGNDCYMVTTIQEDKYFIPAQ